MLIFKVPKATTKSNRAVMEWTERKRKRAKRYVSSDDEVAETTETSVVNHPRQQDSLVANSDIGVVGEEEHQRDDQRFNYHLPPDPKLTIKGPKGKASASISAKGGAKRKAKVDNVLEVSTTSKKRLKLTPKPDDVSVDVVGDGSSTPNVSPAGDRSIHTISKHDSCPPAPPAAPSQQLLPKKQKLPTIKKVKLPHLNASTSSSTVVVDTPVLPLGGKPAQDGVRKTLNGTIDIDLSNKSIYEEIFSKTGQGDGGTPRAGSNRRTKEEERRKELNRQRDEAKAKRALEARQTFDLQAQFDKISRFEEKLKTEQSSALYPNFLAAKWREEWEKGKRRQKDKDWHAPNYSHGHESTTREEGEVR